MSGSSHNIRKLRHFLINGKYFDYNTGHNLYFIVFMHQYLIIDDEKRVPVTPVKLKFLLVQSECSLYFR